MDLVFLLEEDTRSTFIRSVVRTLGCTYILLWSYAPYPSKCLISMDGWFNDDSDHPSSSSTPRFAQSLFEAYRRSICSLENGGGVPGLAFKEGMSYLELTELASLASTQAQRNFYQGAGIKAAVFMGCRNGEIEIGTSSPSNINKEKEIRNLFRNEIIQQSQQGGEPCPTDHSRPSSSSSSWRSLSVGSPENSSLLRNVATSYMTDSLKGISTEQTAISISLPCFPPIYMPNTTPLDTMIPPHQHSVHSYPGIGDIQLPTPAGDDAAMARAMLTVISPPPLPLPPRASYQPCRNHPRRQTGAFKSYASALAPVIMRKPNSRSQQLFKQSISLLRKINSRRIEAELQETRPASNQLHHMISERKRREKLNESFQVLRSLLPPGSKKDKASVLAGTGEHLSALKAEVSDLKEKNQLLESRIFKAREEIKEDSSTGGRVEIRVTDVSEMAAVAATKEGEEEEREIQVGVVVREQRDLTGLVLQLLECLKKMEGVKLLSMEAETHFRQTGLTINNTAFRLKIKASQWNESTLEEAITTTLCDVEP